MRARRVGAATGLAVAVLLTVGPDRLYPRQPREPAPAPPPAPATVTVHGRAGTFGDLPATTPSGQDQTVNAVPGWDFAPGVQAWRTALAADGTVLIPGVSHNANTDANFAPTADRATVAAFHPKANTFSTVEVGRGGASVADLLPIGDEVAFITRSGGAGTPAFGVLTTVDGRWQVAPVRGTVPGGDLHDLAALPRSRDLLVARYGVPGKSNGSLLALRLTGPDRAGRFAVKVLGKFSYPSVDGQQVSVREVQVDPTSRKGDERFAVGLELFRAGTGQFAHFVIQEFGYDARSGNIWPVSAPIIPGDLDRRDPKNPALFGYNAFLYDHAGNLWAARLNGFAGGKLAIYTAATGRRKLDDGPCRHHPGRSPERYRTTVDGLTAWGRACRPDYDILQTKHMLTLQGMVQDPISKDVVVLAFGGALQAIRPAGSGAKMSFRIGNPVDIGRKLLPTVKGNFADHRLGAVDPAHRVWVTAMHARQGQPGVRLDQWLYSVDLDDLFDPAPVLLPEVPGRRVTIQAERSGTVTTTAIRPGVSATVDVDSDAYSHGCADWPPNTSCGYDGEPGNGFLIGDDTGFGHMRGALEYTVEVPAAGRYRLEYRVGTFPVTKDARITLEVAGRRYTDQVSTGGPYRTVRAKEPVTLPAGQHTIRLSVPPGNGGGWFLNSFTLRRI